MGVAASTDIVDAEVRDEVGELPEEALDPVVLVSTLAAGSLRRTSLIALS